MRKFNYTFLTIHNNNNLFNLNIKWRICIADASTENTLFPTELSSSDEKKLPDSLQSTSDFLYAIAFGFSFVVRID